MDFRFSSKRDLYYEKAMKLYFQEGMRVTQINRALPLSRAILYRRSLSLSERGCMAFQAAIALGTFKYFIAKMFSNWW